ncbi:TetR/AcrR family transcriptional regulator [Yinghuangia aomiensis]
MAPSNTTITLTRALTRDQQARRERLVRAALDLAAEGGYASVTMHDVADRAGVARATVYRYFTSKDHLLSEVSALWIGQVIDELTSRSLPAEPAESLTTMLSPARPGQRRTPPPHRGDPPGRHLTRPLRRGLPRELPRLPRTHPRHRPRHPGHPRSPGPHGRPAARPRPRPALRPPRPLAPRPQRRGSPRPHAHRGPPRDVSPSGSTRPAASTPPDARPTRDTTPTTCPRETRP